METQFVANTREPLRGKDALQNVQHLGVLFLTDGNAYMQELGEFKAADTDYQANQGIEHFVEHNQRGAVALKIGKQHPGITGRVYGTPYVERFGKEATQDFPNDQRNHRNQLYGDKWYNQPAKFVDDKVQDVFERGFGLSDVKCQRESRFR